MDKRASMILIIDDDPDFLQQAEEKLTSVSDGGVFFAGNAKQALKFLNRLASSVSLILVDLDLPDVNGFDLTVKIRDRYPDVPVIAISAVYQKTALEIARVFGANEVLSKPISGRWLAAIEQYKRPAG
jgi:CheY-like chemotaxis protein